jgi:hypothetical protein
MGRTTYLQTEQQDRNISSDPSQQAFTVLLSLQPTENGPIHHLTSLILLRK